MGQRMESRRAPTELPWMESVKCRLTDPNSAQTGTGFLLYRTESHDTATLRGLSTRRLENHVSAGAVLSRCFIRRRTTLSQTFGSLAAAWHRTSPAVREGAT
jgi:hypothetical protein